MKRRTENDAEWDAVRRRPDVHDRTRGEGSVASGACAPRRRLHLAFNVVGNEVLVNDAVVVDGERFFEAFIQSAIRRPILDNDGLADDAAPVPKLKPAVVGSLRLVDDRRIDRQVQRQALQLRRQISDGAADCREYTGKKTRF